jgi:hypothetical protein
VVFPPTVVAVFIISLVVLGLELIVVVDAFVAVTRAGSIVVGVVVNPAIVTPGTHIVLRSSALVVLPKLRHAIFLEDHPHPERVQSLAQRDAEQSGKQGFRACSDLVVLAPSLQMPSFVDQPHDSVQSLAHLMRKQFTSAACAVSVCASTANNVTREVARNGIFNLSAHAEDETFL